MNIEFVNLAVQLAWMSGVSFQFFVQFGAKVHNSRINVARDLCDQEFPQYSWRTHLDQNGPLGLANVKIQFGMASF